MKVLEDAAARLVESTPDAPPLETIRVRADVLRRRRRFRQSGLVAVAICALVGAGALATAVVREEGRPANVIANLPSGPTGDTVTYRNDDRGFQISYPRSWFRAEHSLTPYLGGDPDPWEVAAVATYDLSGRNREACGQKPTDALRALGPTDAFVWVYLPTWDPSRFPARPDRFTELPSGVVENSDIIDCLGGTADFAFSGSSYADHGRLFGLLVAIGPEASSQTREQALGVLNSIQLDPSTTASSSPSTTASATTSPPATVPPSTVADGAATSHLTGSYSGAERHELAQGGDCYLDHHLDLTLQVDGDPVPWQFESDYCGNITDGDQWTGTGPFTIDAGERGTLAGRMRSAARLPTTGEPFTLEITGGTRSFKGAAGSCTLDNHLRETGPGQQEQWGTFECDIST